MEDSSEDLPKPPRRSVARPFFSPRTSSGEGISGPLNLGRRSSAQLFTPPGSTPATARADKVSKDDAAPVATPVSAPVSESADGSSKIDLEGDWSPVPLIHSERALEVDSSQVRPIKTDEDGFVVEQYEPKVIELTAAAPDVTSEHSIEVIAYDDANSLLKAAAIEGKDPEVDGLRLESTEFSFEREQPPLRENGYGFWPTESFAKRDEREVQEASQADETEATIDEETAEEAERSSESESAPAPAAVPQLWVNGPRPASSQSLEELKESEPWDLTPSHGLDSISDDPHESGGWLESAVASETAQHSPIAPAPSRDELADALVRIAARVREGTLEVPNVPDMSDESVLAAVLTAFLRTPR